MQLKLIACFYNYFILLHASYKIFTRFILVLPHVKFDGSNYRVQQ